MFFFAIPIIAALCVDLFTNEKPKSILLLHSIGKEATKFFGSVQVRNFVKEEDNNYIYKYAGSQSTLVSAPKLNEGCPDVKLGYCTTQALDTHLNDASLLSNRIKKLEAQLESVLKRMKLLSQDI